MTVRIWGPNMVWEPSPLTSVTLALEHTLDAWDKTPYESGQRFIQRGADCIGALFGVVDDMDGRDRAEFPGMPHDAAMHDRAGAIAAVRELVRRYSPCVKVEPETDKDGHPIYYVEPGDICVTGHPGGGPGHVEMVGAHRNELWHALPVSGFHQGGWAFLEQQFLYAIYRIKDKHRWSA